MVLVFAQMGGFHVHVAGCGGEFVIPSSPPANVPSENLIPHMRAASGRDFFILYRNGHSLSHANNNLTSVQGCLLIFFCASKGLVRIPLGFFFGILKSVGFGAYICK